MRVTFTPTAAQTLREMPTSDGLNYEWVVTFQIDGEAVGTAISVQVVAQTVVLANAMALRKVQEFLSAASAAAAKHQL
jgi:hypothetical protein